MLFHITARVRVTGQGRLAAIAYCMHSHVEWALHGEKKGRKTLKFLVWRLLDDPTVEGLSEEAGGRLSGRKSRLVSRQGQSRHWCPRQHTIGRYRSSLDHGPKVFFYFFFFCHLLTKLSSILLSSWEWCSYSENQNAAPLLQSLLRRTQH